MELQISKTWNTLLRWLLKAASKNREPLAVVHVEENWTVASDGFRLHAVRGRPGCPSVSALKMGNWKFEPLRATDETVQPLPQDTRYPDISSVLPHHEAEITPNGDFLLDAAEITLNGDFLLDALGPMRGTSVTLRFSSYALEIMSTVSGEPVYALIVHTHAQPTTWRPRKEQNERTDEMAQGV